MALIICPECGKEVSDKAPVCIHCGFLLQGIQTEILNVEDVRDNTENIEEQDISEEAQISDNPVIQETAKKETRREAARRQKDTINKLKRSIRGDRIMGFISFNCLIGIAVLVVHLWSIMEHGDMFFPLIIVLFVALLPVGFFYAAVSDISKCQERLEAAKHDISAYDRVVERQKNEDEKRKQEQERINKAMQEHEEAVKAAQHPRCPMCGSTNTARISTLNRATSIAMVGLASSKIGKQYQCNNCKHKW